jgi:hypothetical protein
MRPYDATPMRFCICAIVLLAATNGPALAATATGHATVTVIDPRAIGIVRSPADPQANGVHQVDFE